MYIMFLLPIIITFIVLLIAVLVVATDYRAYSRELRLEEIISIFLPSILVSGIISLVWFLIGVR